MSHFSSVVCRQSLRRRRGGVLLLTMVVLAGVTAILSIMLANLNTEVRGTSTRMDQLRARQLAESGLDYALTIMVAQDPNTINQTQDWFLAGSEGNERFLVGRGSFRMEIRDAASLISLNTAPEESLQKLDLTSEQIDSLLDYREAGTEPRAEGGKDDYYNTLEKPYNAKLRILDSFDELLSIRGFEPNTLFETPEESNDSGYAALPLYQLGTVESNSPNVNGEGQQKQDINGADQNALTQAGIPPPIANSIIQQRQQSGGEFTNMGQVLRTPNLNPQVAGTLVDQFTVGNESRSHGRININTAPEQVLSLLPEMTAELAQGIVSLQTAGINALSELLQVPGIDLNVLASIIDFVATGSDTFMIRVEGTYNRAVVALEGVVRLQNGRAQILKVAEAPRMDMRTLWEWQDETTSETDLGASE